MQSEELTIIKNLLEQLNIPVAYSHFNTSVTPPVAVYRRSTTNNFGADNKVYKKNNNYYVELYTQYKDPELEQRLEDLFDNAEIFYEVESEDYIDSEKMYEVIYTINVQGSYAEPSI